jgi:2-oxoglutarate ferredoxin oxidoreductase subunit delta
LFGQDITNSPQPPFARGGVRGIIWRKILATGMIEIESELCKDCKLCISVCPHRLIESSDRMNPKGYYPALFIEKHLKKEGKKCTGCGLCAIACPEIAIEVYRG